ncbi:head-tail joining protein [Photobacterium ganghwense]|uniref:head-tail joining protein n=1 Tax=Photobacterium ganghwense TaxID=320778 RepID=UPI0039EECC93
MSKWLRRVNRMNSKLANGFGQPVVLHLVSGDRQVSGIFDNPTSLSLISGGGYVADSDPELFLQDADAVGIHSRDAVTVGGKVWLVVKPPEPDGTGMTKLILGHHNGQQSSESAIRY